MLVKNNGLVTNVVKHCKRRRKLKFVKIKLGKKFDGGYIVSSYGNEKKCRRLTLGPNISQQKRIIYLHIILKCQFSLAFIILLV